MAINPDLYIGNERKGSEYANFTYVRFGTLPPITTIVLCASKCKCGDELNPSDYANILEHEYVELACVDIFYSDGGKTWNPYGFNDAARRSKQLE